MSSVFDPGKKDRKRAAALAQQGIMTSGQLSGPGGIGGDFSFKDGNIRSNLSLGSFAEFLPQLQGIAGSLFEQAGGGLPPELRQLGEGTIDRLGDINVQRIQNQGDFDKLGELFGARADFAQRDVFDVGDEFSSRLRKLSERKNQRLVNKTFDRLKRSGKLGTTGGAGIASELDANLFDEGLKFDMAGLDFGSRELSRAFGEALGASGMREQIGARQFGEEMALEQLGGERALQQFGVGSSMFDQFLRNQQQGMQLGMGAMAGAQSLSMMPLQFLQALQGMGTAASNTYFGAAGVNAQNAANARSPFLDALNAAGSFMTGLGDFRRPPVGG